MCDTMVALGRGRTLFAKNSDRPAGELQVVEQHPARHQGGELRTQYTTLPDRGSYATVGSRPVWLWGFEHGLNERGVAIGNEKLYTARDPHSAPASLIGMDLVRLGLEQASSADAALDVITGLIERHGQGGSGEEHADDPYFSSFLVADHGAAWILETSGTTWAARPVRDHGAISNRISLSTDWTRGSADLAPGSDFDVYRAPDVDTAIADGRLATTSAAVARAGVTAEDLAATLRDHGDGSGLSVCMHIGDYSVTAAAMICELSGDGAPARAWFALGSPCTSVFVPAFPPVVAPELADPAVAARFAALRTRAERDPAIAAAARDTFAPVERALWEQADALLDGAPAARAAFAAGAFAPVLSALGRLGI